MDRLESEGKRLYRVLTTDCTFYVDFFDRKEAEIFRDTEAYGPIEVYVNDEYLTHY